MTPRQGKPMTVKDAVAFALSDPDPEARNRDTVEIVGRLLTVLHSKGVLLPREIVHVLGVQYEEVKDNGD
jgi:hypothetical protein